MRDMRTDTSFPKNENRRIERLTVVEKNPAAFSPLTGRVLGGIREQHLVSGRQPLVVAVSGGADSVCLLHVLVELRETLGLKLHVAHLDHRLRGEASAADARYVADLACQLEVPATIEARDVTSYQSAHRLSPEEAAREVRYTFLAGVAASIGADRVAVGHTVDDHIETILMHLVRGAGTRGLRGLPSSGRCPAGNKSLTVIRPLLMVSRAETEDYCRQYRLTPRIDASNLSLTPLRNRIRRELVPLLRGYNPQVKEALLRAARIAADDLAFLEKEADRKWRNIAREEENAVTLDRKKFLRLPVALQRQLLRMSIEKLLGSLKDIETRHIEGLLASLRKPAGRKISLPAGLQFTLEYDRYLLSASPAALSPFPPFSGEFTLKVPGETRIPGWQVVAAIVDPEEVNDSDSGFTAYFDYGKTGGRLTVRNRRAGDRFQPLGMSRTKKLGIFMIDSRIPGAWRGRVPIVCSPGHIIWVVGCRLDERAKVTAGTGRVLRLEFSRL